MQIHFLTKLVDQLTLKRRNLLLKTGLILIIAICSTSEIAMSRIAEEEAESTEATQTDATKSHQGSSTEAETPAKPQHAIQFGLPNGNPFDSGSASKHFIWQSGEAADTAQEPAPELTEDPEPITDSDRLIQPYLDSLQRWQYPPDLTDLSKLYNGSRSEGGMKKVLPFPWILTSE